VETPPLIDGVQLGGGQDEPMTGTNASSGEMLWTQPGNLVYGDVWPVGDGAVFATENETTFDLVAYEVATGDVRWRRNLSEPLGPWHVIHDDRLLAMWNNLEVVATDDGTVRWRTEYPKPLSGPIYPRMMGGLANSKSVFVSFTSVASGGD
jgi:outer membrane protein assembly factor BamB